jgi:hypothetical protein
VHWRREEEQGATKTFSKKMAGKAEWPTVGSDKPLPEIGQVAVQKAHLLNQ